MFGKDKLISSNSWSSERIRCTKCNNTYLSSNAHIYLQENVYVLLACRTTIVRIRYVPKAHMEILVGPLTLMSLGTAAVFAPKLADLIVVAVSVKTAPLLDFLAMTVVFDLTLVLEE